ncbi:hypothetical protein QBC47DRAFT_439326 [Echria macrotheca]|uniref:Uncharacterized protein n=1 Tax=Echria macrotheca TaxID=438768 RepID=A0AAJ0B4B7_9PEZI|nr:hypothetical protein QBC47DRAFT_439326 [Echria macrotheca]
MSASSSAEPSPDMQLDDTSPPPPPTTITTTSANTTNDDNNNTNGNGSKKKTTRRPRARPLTRDEIIEIRALRKYAKMTHEQIVAATPFTINQVQVACKNTLRWQKKPDRWSIGPGEVGGAASGASGAGAGSGMAEGGTGSSTELGASGGE